MVVGTKPGATAEQVPCTLRATVIVKPTLMG